MANTKDKKRAIDSRSAEKRLAGYYVRHWNLFVSGLVCTVAIRGIDLAFAFLIGDVLRATFGKDQAKLTLVAAAIVGIHVVKWVLTYGQTCLISSATQKIAVRLRNELYSHLQALSLSFFERTKIGHLMSRMTNDVNVIQQSSQQVIEAVSAPVGIIAGLIAIFVTNWRLALVSVVVLPFMSYSLVKISRGMRNLSEFLQHSLSDVAAVLQETLSAVRIVKSFGMEDYEANRFAGENQRTYGAAMRAIRRSALMSPTIELLGVTGIAFVLWYGGLMVVRNTMPGFDAADMVVFLMLLRGISDSARQLGRINITYHQIMTGATRIFDVLDEVPDVRELPEAVVMPDIAGRIEFRNVSFGYSPDKPVLHDISFTVEPGRQVALVGPSGAGKSTIANLIPRFYDVTGGAVLIDGMDVRNATLSSLRRQIGIVPQETMLFSSTIRENIAYGRMDASDADVQSAAEAANAREFIEAMPEGYSTLVGERGMKLSGGQRQRIAIARALLKDPRLLILDEATSSLDVASEQVVQEALERLMANRTTLVIAHRLSTIVNADRIVVMKDGRIAEIGSHTELMSEGGVYAQLYAIQSRKVPESAGGRK